ncbi:MAG: hypothetical protein KDJ52_13595 [Anaerolineae bacterium]|nr:hypothetical protein [Anaerolineae bacterium]
MLNQSKSYRHKRSRTKFLVWLSLFSVLVSMACSMGGTGTNSSNKAIWISQTLPTLTPTSSAEIVAAVAAEPPSAQFEPPVNGQAVPVAARPTLVPTAVTVVSHASPTQPDRVTAAAPASPPTPTSPPPAPIPTEPLAAAAPTLPSEPALPSLNPEPNPEPNASGWTFMGVQISYQDEEGVIIDGDIINNTGAAQDIVKLTGTIFNSQGQGVADVDDAAAYWPLETVPPGGQVPFEMTVYHVQDVADFALDVVAQPSRENPRQDFELADLDPSLEEGSYCVTGKLWNRGDPLLDYLLVLVILYNDQDKVVNFGTFQGNAPEEVLNDDALNFEVCTDSYNHQIARHELRAIGL